MGLSDEEQFKNFLEASKYYPELEKVLARPTGREPEFTALQELRGMYCYEKMWNATLEPGEAWEIVTGQRDNELNLPPETSKRGHRTKCKDCGDDIVEPESRMKSDAARCAKCFKKKKRAENQRYRGGQAG